MEAIANLSWVLSKHRAGCLLPPALLLARRKQSPDAERSRNPSKSTLAQDAVAAAVLHKHHSIIRVGAGLIQFVYRSHSRLATEATCSKNPFLPSFARFFWIPWPPQASRASLSPRQWAMTCRRLSLHPCTAPLSCSLQPLFKLSLLRIRPSQLQFVSIVALLLNHGNLTFDPVCVF